MKFAKTQVIIAIKEEMSGTDFFQKKIGVQSFSVQSFDSVCRSALIKRNSWLNAVHFFQWLILCGKVVVGFPLTRTTLTLRSRPLPPPPRLQRRPCPCCPPCRRGPSPPASNKIFNVFSQMYQLFYLVFSSLSLSFGWGRGGLSRLRRGRRRRRRGGGGLRLQCIFSF